MTKTAEMPETSGDYKNLIDLLAVYAGADSRLKAMASEVQESLLETVDERRKEYAELQAAMTDAETAMEIIARRHPEWFASARSIKTPYGVVKFHASAKLVAANEEASIVLIESKCDDEEKAKYLRTETTLNLEALKTLSDAQLKQFRIERVEDDNFSVKASTIDLGKAVKQAAEKGDK